MPALARPVSKRPPKEALSAMIICRCPEGRRANAGGGGQHLFEHVAFVGFGAGQRPAGGKVVQGAQQMQTESPEVAGVRGAVAVLSPTGQVRPLWVSRVRPHSTGVESATRTPSSAIRTSCPSRLSSTSGLEIWIAGRGDGCLGPDLTFVS